MRERGGEGVWCEGVVREAVVRGCGETPLSYWIISSNKLARLMF